MLKKKKGVLIGAVVVAVLVIWAFAQLSTGIVRVMNVLDIGSGDEDPLFIDEDLLDGVLPTPTPTEFTLTDQDYDVPGAVPETDETERPKTNSFLDAPGTGIDD